MHLEGILDTWQTIPVPNYFKYIILPTFMFLIAEGDDVKEQASKKDMDTKNFSGWSSSLNLTRMWAQKVKSTSGCITSLYGAANDLKAKGKVTAKKWSKKPHEWREKEGGKDVSSKKKNPKIG